MLAALSYDPIPIFELGPISLSLHGLFAGVGFAVGSWIMVRAAGRRGFSKESVISVMTWGLVGAILGTRLGTVPAHLGDPGYGFGDIVSLTGDYSILGGYAGGIIAGVWRMRMVNLPVLGALDMVAPGMALGAVIGRIGDLAIVEHLGSRTSFFLGFTVKVGHDLAPQHDGLECTVRTAIDGVCGTYHHTALYDLLGALVLFGVLMYLRKSWSGAKYGQLFMLWGLWYGFQRFLIDFTRLQAAKDGTVADSVMGPFTGSQWGALGFAVLGLIALWYTGRNSPVVSASQDLAYGAQVLEPAAVEAPEA